MANLVKTGGFFSIPPRDVRNGMECIRGKGGKYSSPLREMGNEAIDLDQKSMPTAALEEWLANGASRSNGL